MGCWPQNEISKMVSEMAFPDTGQNGKLQNNLIDGTGIEKSWEPLNRIWSERSYVKGCIQEGIVCGMMAVLQ